MAAAAPVCPGHTVKWDARSVGRAALAWRQRYEADCEEARERMRTAAEDAHASCGSGVGQEQCSVCETARFAAIREWEVSMDAAKHRVYRNRNNWRKRHPVCPHCGYQVAIPDAPFAVRVYRRTAVVPRHKGMFGGAAGAAEAAAASTAAADAQKAWHALWAIAGV